MFFQWNRFEKNHSYKEWGHFTSKDLLHWNWEGSALLPDQFYEQNGVYSGSALIKDGQLRLFYTGNNKSGGVRKSSQCLAVTEDGKTFQKKALCYQHLRSLPSTSEIRKYGRTAITIIW